MKLFLVYPLQLFVFAVLVNAKYTEKSKKWVDKAQKELKERLGIKNNNNKPKNVILFIGDGMGISVTTASRIYKGQLEQFSGEEELLFHEKFPTVGLSKTYCNDVLVPDSASTATSIFTGVKVNYYTAGVAPEVVKDDCAGAQKAENHLKNIFEFAQNAGLDTGLITNTRLTHATPCAVYANTANRMYEGDSLIPETAKDCVDHATQFVNNKVSNKLKVVFAGGRTHFLPKSLNGSRLDNQNLIEEWKKGKSQHGQKRVFIETLEELKKQNMKTPHQLLGLFSNQELPYELYRDETQPSLTDLVEAAIKKLRMNEKGYILMVESGRIDQTLHENRAKKALHEVLQLEKAVAMARKMTKEEDTLIIVTSDHSEPLVINGNAPRGTHILGLSKSISKIDNLPYTILNFGNGPGYKYHVLDNNNVRRNLTEVDTSADEFIQPSAVAAKSKSAHSGEEVAIYASGPMAHLFDGVHEENYTFHVMCYVLCLCDGRKMCRSHQNENEE